MTTAVRFKIVYDILSLPYLDSHGLRNHVFKSRLYANIW